MQKNSTTFRSSRSSDYPQLSVAQKIYPHGVRGYNERCPVHANDGAPEMRERYTKDTKTKNVPFKLSLPGAALHSSLTEYTLQNNSDPHLLRM